MLDKDIELECVGGAVDVPVFAVVADSLLEGADRVGVFVLVRDGLRDADGRSAADVDAGVTIFFNTSDATVITANAGGLGDFAGVVDAEIL